MNQNIDPILIKDLIKKLKKERDDPEHSVMTDAEKKEAERIVEGF
jgi:hypothetical protein